MSTFSDDLIDRIWRKGIKIDDWNSDEYRLDAAGAMMIKSHRGSNDIYDWKIDHVYPKAKLREAGIPEEAWDHESNLRPFNAKNNNRKSNDYPTYTIAAVFDETVNSNVESEIDKVVNEDVQRDVNRAFGFHQSTVLGDHSID